MERDQIYKLLSEEFGLVPQSERGHSPRILGQNVRIGHNVEFGLDVVIYDDVIIGDNVRIGDRVTLRNTRLEEGCVIEAYTIVGYSTLTGGFSHKLVEDLRPAPTVVGAQTLIRTHCTIYQNVTIGDHCWINHSVVLREHTKIGHHTCIGTMSESEGYNAIGAHCLIHSQVHMCARMTIEDYVFVAPFTVFTNGNPMNFARDFPSEEEGPLIRFGTQIAVNSVILPRVIVGYESLIGASAVVTKDAPALSVIMGVPGKVIGRVPDHLRMPEVIRSQYYNGNLDPEVDAGSNKTKPA